ncbi:MAG TPA: hypothetical protein VHK91_12400 [Flavisolibacter sp.]|jgi:hypothetical protein|nr:hypothetical protein [Flavisolibacter sp.]
MKQEGSPVEHESFLFQNKIYERGDTKPKNRKQFKYIKGRINGGMPAWYNRRLWLENKQKTTHKNANQKKHQKQKGIPDHWIVTLLMNQTHQNHYVMRLKLRK